MVCPIYLWGLYCPPLIPARIQAIPGIPEESILAQGPAKFIIPFQQNVEWNGSRIHMDRMAARMTGTESSMPKLSISKCQHSVWVSSIHQFVLLQPPPPPPPLTTPIHHCLLTTVTSLPPLHHCHHHHWPPWSTSITHNHHKVWQCHITQWRKWPQWMTMTMHRNQQTWWCLLACCYCHQCWPPPTFIAHNHHNKNDVEVPHHRMQECWPHWHDQNEGATSLSVTWQPNNEWWQCHCFVVVYVLMMVSTLSSLHPKLPCLPWPWNRPWWHDTMTMTPNNGCTMTPPPPHDTAMNDNAHIHDKNEHNDNEHHTNEHNDDWPHMTTPIPQPIWHNLPTDDDAILMVDDDTTWIQWQNLAMIQCSNNTRAQWWCHVTTMPHDDAATWTMMRAHHHYLPTVMSTPTTWQCSNTNGNEGPPPPPYTDGNKCPTPHTHGNEHPAPPHTHSNEHLPHTNIDNVHHTPTATRPPCTTLLSVPLLPLLVPPPPCSFPSL